MPLPVLEGKDVLLIYFILTSQKTKYKHTMEGENLSDFKIEG